MKNRIDVLEAHVTSQIYAFCPIDIATQAQLTAMKADNANLLEKPVNLSPTLAPRSTVESVSMLSTTKIGRASETKKCYEGIQKSC
ncbi:hypothetical protein RDI58_001019 [Solanum bulbocastanum]|uniref:Uncharacterized protein n=1 Tax=Solanum bulbocastanum TaxID=147425 RepID=A0AAN8YPL1_SOLBU